MIRIVHTADLHLDKNAFPGDERLNRLRKNEMRALFANIMMYVRSKNVDVLLFCGDLLDSPVCERETAALILREFENSPGVEIFIAPGRHDAYLPGSFYKETVFPDNVHIFKEEHLSVFHIDRLNADVYGYGFCSRNLERSRLAVAPTVDRERFNLFAGYASLHNDIKTCPVHESEIAHSGIDYLAFGSEHTPSALCKAGSSYYAMSGCPEGGDFSDPGQKSLRIAAMEKKEGELLFQSKCISFAHRVFEKARFDAQGKDLQTLANEVFAYVREKSLDADSFLRAEFYGRVPITFRIDESAFDKVKSRVFHFEIADETTMVFQGEGAGEGKDFKETFAGFASKKTNDEALRSMILKEGLRALERIGEGHEI